ncbi:MAG: 3-ketoacyl-ACP reductase [Oscillospiraceae bacterium]|jgi:NAD(P)-dependent dehydrogenase (short-subunit alcohol dehydrogenase family)|nr:3-ketoacyl-ACP reductase [Oscillospiraceae bacterium]
MSVIRTKTAVVTGSTRGIGRGIADALWEDGYTVIYSGTGAERPGNLPEDRPYQLCDVSIDEQRRALIDRVINDYNRLDVYVSNAGVAPSVRLDVLDTTEDSYDRVMGINLRGAFFLAQYAAKAMLAQQKQAPPDYSPRIIFITSISSYAVSINRAEYCVSKAGLSMTAQLFAARLVPEGIPVFEIRPGVIETDMTSGVKARYESMIANGLTPIKRMGEPSDVARMVRAACSGLLDFTTGQVLNADGGYHIRIL